MNKGAFVKGSLRREGTLEAGRTVSRIASESITFPETLLPSAMISGWLNRTGAPPPLLKEPERGRQRGSFTRSADCAVGGDLRVHRVAIASRVRLSGLKREGDF